MRAVLGLVPLFLVAAVAVVFARAWLHQIGDRSWATAATFAAAMMSTIPTAISRVTGDLVVATLLFGGLAIAGLAFLWKRAPVTTYVAPSAPKTPRLVWVVVALGLFFVSWAALGGHWWDEHNCHDGVVTVLARGIVPPVHPLFPTEPFRYHYGFDVLAAQLRAFTGASADDVIDGATIVCFVLLMGMARELGATLGGRLGSSIAMILVPFGGGLLSVFFWGQSGPMEWRWSAIPAEWLHLEIPPPVISNFFQHPQSLGMPLALAVLRVFVDDDDHPLRLVTGGLMLGALALAQIVFFGVLGLVLGVVVVYRFARRRDLRRAAASVGALLGALGVAYLLGGMLERGPDVGNVMRFGRSFFTGAPFAIFMLHVVHFGAPMVAAFVGIVLVIRRPTPLRVALVTAAVIGFSIPNFVTYERSWDIVKFYGIGGFFANLLVAAFVSDLWRVRQRALAAGLVFVTVFTGYLWIVRMGILDGRYGIPKMNFPAPSAIGEITAERMEPFVDDDDFVLTPHTDLGLAGGMRTPGFDWRRDGQGYMLDREVSDRLHQAWSRAIRSLSPEDLAILRARFVVLAPSDIARLTPAAREALADPKRFEHLFDVKEGGDERRVYRVLSRSE